MVALWKTWFISGYV